MVKNKKIPVVYAKNVKHILQMMSVGRARSCRPGLPTFEYIIMIIIILKSFI